MRNLIKIIAVFLFVGITATVSAQTPKFGHIDLQALVQLMPERATAETEFNKFQMTDFEALGDSASEIKRNAKVAEIQDMQQRIQNYQQTANAQLQQKQTELLKPVFDKAEKTIGEVAKEKGLLYVFDIGSKVVLYKSNESVDVLPLVKTKLGL